MSSLPYERAESVVYLLLALTIVGGGAAILSSAGVATDDQTVAAIETQAGVASPRVAAPISAPRRQAAAAPVRPADRPPAPAAAPAPQSESTAPPPPSQTVAEVAGPSRDASNSIADDAHESPNAPKPLAPPSPDIREKLIVREAPALPPEVSAYQAPTEMRSAFDELGARGKRDSEEAKTAETADAGRIEKCFVKLSGRVQANGACRVKRSGASVVFDVSGRPLEITQKTGRVWAATLGGRHLGNVYKIGGCWAARGFYACEKG